MTEDLFHSFEQKYIFMGQQKEMILDWLEYCYVRDPVFDFGTISSIYYDTPALSSYYEKRNSDYLKSKVRLRWYEDLQTSDPDVDVTCYLEVKRKYGTVRQKERMEVVIPLKKLLDDPFSDRDILNLPYRIHELRCFPPGILVPTLLIQYDRYRFIDSQGRSRVALDTDICCNRVNEVYFPLVPPVHLGMGVLEVKGNQNELPDSLNPIQAQLTKSAFSKYAQCFEHLGNPLELRR
jgi:hypothetical protein